MLNFIKKQSLNVLFLVSSFLFINCSPEDGTPTACSVRWSMELQEELTALSDATIAFAQNQTVSNCETLRSARQGFVNAMRPYGNCQALTGQSRTEWKNALEEAEQDIAETDCSQES